MTNLLPKFEVFQIVWNLVQGCVSVCVCVCVLCISFRRKSFSWLKHNNKCIARDQASDVVLKKLLCVYYLRRHVIDNHSRTFNLATVQECQLNRAEPQEVKDSS